MLNSRRSAHAHNPRRGRSGCPNSKMNQSEMPNSREDGSMWVRGAKTGIRQHTQTLANWKGVKVIIDVRAFQKSDGKNVNDIF
jgi:hypothetical protein